MSEIYNEHIVKKSRKDHKCDICEDAILKGSSYKSINALFDSRFTETKVCNDCIPILEKFFEIQRDNLGDGYSYDEVRQDVYETVRNECPDEEDCTINCIKCEYAIKKYLEYENKKSW